MRLREVRESQSEDSRHDLDVDVLKEHLLPLGRKHPLCPRTTVARSRHSSSAITRPDGTEQETAYLQKATLEQRLRIIGFGEEILSILGQSHA